MASVNYNTIHTKLKAKIDAATGGFRYVPVDKAVNLNLGEYPSGLRNTGYNIRLAGQERSKFEDDQRFRLRVEVQFTLNAKSDVYLTQLGNAIDAIASFESLSSSDFSEYQGSDIYEHLWESFPLGELILVVFSEIYFEIIGT